ncbi:hypothetical protein TgHK011_000519 [Trichoderma gracile]|nr:hypothetical protein TgHK011_000519 [Trichoderma gracile]
MGLNQPIRIHPLTAKVGQRLERALPPIDSRCKRVVKKKEGPWKADERKKGETRQNDTGVARTTRGLQHLQGLVQPQPDRRLDRAHRAHSWILLHRRLWMASQDRAGLRELPHSGRADKRLRIVSRPSAPLRTAPLRRLSRRWQDSGCDRQITSKDDPIAA